MSLTLDQYITLISLGISSFSLVAVIFLLSATKKLASREYHAQQVDIEAGDKEVEVSAIVSEFKQRLRRLEEGLVDQKVKMEILELRATRAIAQVGGPALSYSKIENTISPSNKIDNAERPSSEKMEFISELTSLSPQKERQEPNKKLATTETEVLRLVFEGRGKISAREIQQRIGRTREHTARMMNSLYHDGLVERDVTARPFSYSITEKGRDVLKG